METIQQLAAGWWAATDASTHMAVIAGAAIVAIVMLFTIIGMHINPMRKPPSEIDFRQFAAASFAPKPPEAAVEDAAERAVPTLDSPDDLKFKGPRPRAGHK